MYIINFYTIELPPFKPYSIALLIESSVSNFYDIKEDGYAESPT